MALNLIDKIGDWNPQLLRELKGRLRVFHVAIAAASSLLLQIVVFLYQLRDYPSDKYPLTGSYCRLAQSYNDQQTQLYKQQDLLYQQLNNVKKIKPLDSVLAADLNSQIIQAGRKITNLQKYLEKNFCPSNEMNIQLWWRDHYEYIFLSFSVIFIFTLLVAGTYLLINDLAKEESRGTLNFIRLSPQSETSILTGKLLGVPVIIYLFTLTAIPLHLWSGRGAKIAFSYILSFYVVLAGCCFLFYSAALLFSLVNRWAGGFQPWLGSGAVLLFLFVTLFTASNSGLYLDNPFSSLRLFAPWDITNYFFPNLFRVYRGSPLKDVQFFYFPIGKSVVTITGFYLVNYALCSYWIWQALKRRFRNANFTIFSKGQSYLLVACSQVFILGFSLHTLGKNEPGVNIYSLGFINFLLILALIAMLTPHRQIIQDWARYRHENPTHRRSSQIQSLWQDLLWDEKSPAIVAIAINLIMATIPLVAWILLDNLGHFNHKKAVLGMVLFITMMMIYATTAQLTLLMKNRRRSLWAIGIIGSAILLPPTILQFLSIQPGEDAKLWIFSTFPWPAINYASQTTIFMAILAEFTVIALLNFQLTKQVKLAGESSTKALLSGR
ncbi:ABC transporter permease subunit [Fortiea contorta]|uniref:ABC transporter permease subunit n=1 Tax=Fortiea contorta TaxID=1892405 RepID=UPI000361135D|nr:ABC transporter permease subunit [Fortiea contorta]